MECLNGRVIAKQQVIAESVEVWLAKTGDGDSDWEGTFELPSGTHVDTGAGYRLELEDGRSGEFTVTNVGGADDEPHRVAFYGTGPLS